MQIKKRPRVAAAIANDDIRRHLAQSSSYKCVPSVTRREILRKAFYPTLRFKIPRTGGSDEFDHSCRSSRSQISPRSVARNKKSHSRAGARPTARSGPPTRPASFAGASSSHFESRSLADEWIDQQQICPCPKENDRRLLPLTA